MRLDTEAILGLCKLRDRFGVLSVFVDADPEHQNHPQPPWSVDIKNQLGALRSRVKDEGPRERWVALRKRLDAASRDLEALLDPREPGRGRALFVMVEKGTSERVTLQVPLSDLVVLKDTAHVRPLLAALDEGRPAGVVGVERSAVRVLDWGLGEAEELATHSFDEASGDWREMKGPGPSAPAVKQQSSSQRDKFDRRMDENRDRFLRSVAGRISEQARERGWDRLVVFRGDGGRLGELEKGLASPDGMEIISVEGHLDTAANDAARRVGEVVHDAQRSREASLVEQAMDRAASGNAGVVGADDTLAVLAEGRVSHLLFDSAVQLSGFRAADGRLFTREPPAGVADQVAPEPDLAERMIEQALDTSARVTPVDGEAAELLGTAGGVAAILRW